MSIELSNSEKIAYQMVTAVPAASKEVVQANGAIDIKDLHAYLRKLVREMELADTKRRSSYTDVDAKVE